MAAATVSLLPYRVKKSAQRSFGSSPSPMGFATNWWLVTQHQINKGESRTTFTSLNTWSKWINEHSSIKTKSSGEKQCCPRKEQWIVKYDLSLEFIVVLAGERPLSTKKTGVVQVIVVVVVQAIGNKEPLLFILSTKCCTFSEQRGRVQHGRRRRVCHILQNRQQKKVTGFLN